MKFTVNRKYSKFFENDKTSDYFETFKKRF